MPANKYDALRDWLKNQLSDRIQLTFEDIEDEDRIGVTLPLSAKIQRSWWGNEGRDSHHYQCRAWINAGWHVESVDLWARTVIFARQPA